MSPGHGPAPGWVRAETLYNILGSPLLRVIVRLAVLQAVFPLPTTATCVWARGTYAWWRSGGRYVSPWGHPETLEWLAVVLGRGAHGQGHRCRLCRLSQCASQSYRLCAAVL